MNRLDELYARVERELPGYECVFGRGNPSAKVLLIGEAPGAQEVKQNLPFVGQAGKNLDEFLLRLNLKREEIFITNVVKFRPTRPGAGGGKANRPPTKAEIGLCSACLLEEIGIIRPKLIVTLGNVALRAAAGEKESIGKVHGKLLKGPGGALLFPLYHPASIIYNQSLKMTYSGDIAILFDILHGLL